MNVINRTRGVAPPGTRPAGAHDEREAARRVREMFSRIAPRYDLLNHLLSLELDRLWRRRAARRFHHMLVRPEARVLDLCCGTGDLLLALERESRAASIFGCDFSHPMLLRAQDKMAREGRDSKGCPEGAPLTEADALDLPFPTETFDLVTSAFGLRNLANYERGLREMYRVLKPEGQAGILEFAAPRSRTLGSVYRLYFTRILPRIGGVISGDASAYHYLPASVAEFAAPEQLVGLMSQIGFSEVRFERWTMGIVTLHLGRR